MEWTSNYYVNPVELLRFLKGNKYSSFGSSSSGEGKSYDGALIPRSVDGNINIYPDAFTGDDVVNAIKKMLSQPEGSNIIIFTSTYLTSISNNPKASMSRASTLSSNSNSANHTAPNEIYEFKDEDLVKIASVALGCGIIRRVRRGVEFVSRLRNRSYSLGTSDNINDRSSATSSSASSTIADAFLNQEQFKPGSSRFYRYGSEDHFKYALYITVLSCSGLYSNRTKGVVHPVVRITWRTMNGTSTTISTSKKATSKGTCDWNETFVLYLDAHNVEIDINDPVAKNMKKKNPYGLPFKTKPAKESPFSFPHLELSILDHFHVRDHEIAEHSVIPITAIAQNLTTDYINSEESVSTILLPLTIFDEQSGYNVFGTTSKTKSKHDMVIKLNARVILSGYPSNNPPFVPRNDSKIEEEEQGLQMDLDDRLSDIEEVDDISHDDQNSQVTNVEEEGYIVENDQDRQRRGSTLGRIDENGGGAQRKSAEQPKQGLPEQSNISKKYVSFVTSSEDAGMGVISHGYIQLLKSTIKNIQIIEKKIDEAIKMYGNGFSFAYPKLSFEIIACSESAKLISDIIINPSRPEFSKRKESETIQFGSFEIVAPLIPHIVHRLSAPIVHSALAMIAMGEKAARDAVMRRHRVYITFKVFHEYTIQMAALWERVTATNHKYTQKLSKFEHRGLKTMHRSGERVLFMQDYVRGAIDGKTSLVSLGNLYVTSHSLLYVRETLMGHKDAAQFDLTRAFRVSPSDGHTMFGLIILFNTEQSPQMQEREQSGGKDASLAYSSNNENSSCVFRFHSKSARDLTLKIIQEVIGFQMYLRSFLMPLLSSLNPPSIVKDRAIELSVDALLSHVLSLQAIRLVANTHISKKKPNQETTKDMIAKKILGETSDSDPMTSPFLADKNKDGTSPRNGRMSDLHGDFAEQEAAVLEAAERDLAEEEFGGSNTDENEEFDDETDNYRGILMPDLFYKMLRAKKRGDVTSISGVMEFFSNENQESVGQIDEGSQQSGFLTSSKHTNGALALRSFSSFCTLSAYREKGINLPWESVTYPPKDKFSSCCSLFTLEEAPKDSYQQSSMANIRERVSSWLDPDVPEDSSDDLIDLDDQDSDNEDQLPRASSSSRSSPNNKELMNELMLGDSALHLTRWVRKWFIDFVQQRLESDIRARAKLQSLSQNVALFKKLVEPIRDALGDVKRTYEELVSWEIPILSALAFILLLGMIYADVIWYFPSFIIFLFVYHLLKIQNKRKKNQLDDIVIPARPKRTLMEKYQRAKYAYITSKNVLYRVNLLLLKIRGLLTSENPKITGMLITALIIAGLILAFVPAKYFQYGFVFYAFTSKLKKKTTSKGRLRRILLKYWASIPSSRLLLPSTTTPTAASKHTTFTTTGMRRKTKSEG